MINKNCVQLIVCLSACPFQHNRNASAFRPPEPNLRCQYTLLNSSRTTTDTRNKDYWRQAIHSSLRSLLELLGLSMMPEANSQLSTLFRVQVESEQSSITSSGEIAVFAPDFLYLLPPLPPFLNSCFRCCLLTRKFGTAGGSIKQNSRFD